MIYKFCRFSWQKSTGTGPVPAIGSSLTQCEPLFTTQQAIFQILILQEGRDSDILLVLL